MLVIPAGRERKPRVHCWEPTSPPGREAHLFEGVCIQEDPAKLNDLGRVLCNIYAMLIAGRSHVHDHIAVDAELRALLRRHFGRVVRVVVVRSQGGVFLVGKKKAKPFMPGNQAARVGKQRGRR